MPPVYLLTLGKTYYDKGFFNLGVEVDRYVRRDSGPITLALGHKSHIIEGHVNREANPNGTPAHMASTKRTFQNDCLRTENERLQNSEFFNSLSQNRTLRDHASVL